MTSNDNVSRLEVYEYLCDRVHCDTSCRYAENCDYFFDGLKTKDCYLRKTLETNPTIFQTWFNIHLGGLSGARAELEATARKLKLQAESNDDAIPYYNSLVKLVDNIKETEAQVEKENKIIIRVTPMPHSAEYEAWFSDLTRIELREEWEHAIEHLEGEMKDATPRYAEKIQKRIDFCKNKIAEVEDVTRQWREEADKTLLENEKREGLSC